MVAADQLVLADEHVRGRSQRVVPVVALAARHRRGIEVTEVREGRVLGPDARVEVPVDEPLARVRGRGERPVGGRCPDEGRARVRERLPQGVFLDRDDAVDAEHRRDPVCRDLRGDAPVDRSKALTDLGARDALFDVGDDRTLGACDVRPVGKLGPGRARELLACDRGARRRESCGTSLVRRDRVVVELDEDPDGRSVSAPQKPRVGLGQPARRRLRRRDPPGGGERRRSERCVLRGGGAGGRARRAGTYAGHEREHCSAHGDDGVSRA